ncbi:helix-turn-helix domain-containing protein [Terrabacter sp. GCM10028922]|uniref:helix-turn-helix domain-containing protein n=1 Tax=Terrabacter sp. GCM10028922 TaxID=3273428 RepID=UPI00360E0DF5
MDHPPQDVAEPTPTSRCRLRVEPSRPKERFGRAASALVQPVRRPVPLRGPGTLHSRIARAEELTGLDLDVADTRVALRLALSTLVGE